MIEAAGFGAPRFRNLTGGVAALHSGWRIAQALCFATSATSRGSSASA